MMKTLRFMILALLCVAAQGAWAQTYITDVRLVGDASRKEAQDRYDSFVQQGWTGIYTDLNEGAGTGSHYIYLMYKTNNSPYSSGVPITDFFLRVSESADAPDSFSFDGRTYQLAYYQSEDGEFRASKGDLALNGGGDYKIHLYYTKDAYEPARAVTGISIVLPSTNLLGNLSSDVDVTHFLCENFGSTPCNLNKDAGGAFVCMSVTKSLTTPPDIPEGGVYYIEHGWDDVNKKLTGTVQTLASNEFTELSGNHTGDLHLSGGNYVVRGNVHVSDIIFVEGNTNLILCDGAKLAVAKGVLVSPPSGTNCSLSIFGQVENCGWLVNEQEQEDESVFGRGTAEDPSYPGIGTFSGMASTINFHGGTIDVKARNACAAAIGSGYGKKYNQNQNKDMGTINIYDGTIMAIGGNYGGYDPEKYSEEFGSAGIGTNCSFAEGAINIYGGKITASGNWDGPGIGTGSYEHQKGVQNNKFTITINGGCVVATGGVEAAGIGCGDHTGGGILTTINGGRVIATGGSDGAGIGGGNQGDGNIVTINGGHIETYGGRHAAGIGSGQGFYEPSHGGTLVVNGGEVYAHGGKSAAGIGGGEICYGADVTVNGGKVYAYGGEDAAGIGSGEDFRVTSLHVNGGKLTVTGGEVYAYGKEDGAGIGGGGEGRGATVSITGGIVVAEAGEHDTGYRAIGPGYDNDDYGELTIGDLMMVSSERMATASERKNMCWYRTRVRVEPCTHGSLTYTINGDNTHTAHCAYCTTPFSAEAHTFENDVCTLCGAGKTTHTVSAYLPDGNSYGSAITYTMATGAVFNLPAPPDVNTPANMEFAGWLEAAPTELGSFVTDGNETLLSAGDEYTISGDVSFTARYKYIDIVLANASYNDELLSRYDGKKAQTVTLTGRTLYKDGSWNTLCLPFNVALGGSPLENATLMELDVEAGTYDHITGFDDATGTLYLNFKAANSIEAGKPYIIKWASGSNITPPEFSNVTISNSVTQVASTDGTFAFVGTYSHHAYTEENKSILFLGGDNTLYYPQSGASIGACRAYFALNGITAGDLVNNVREFKLNFGDDATGILECTTDHQTRKDDAWFTLEGVRLQGKPSSAGVYINNGKKRVIK